MTESLPVCTLCFVFFSLHCSNVGPLRIDRRLLPLDDRHRADIWKSELPEPEEHHGAELIQATVGWI
jgi:hypothetical protein